MSIKKPKSEDKMAKEKRQYLKKGKRLLSEGKMQQALIELKKAEDENDIYPDLYNSMGLAYSLLGQYDDAVKSFRKALELNTNYIEAHLNLALTLNNIGEVEEAKREFEIVGTLERAKGGDIGFSVKAKLANAHKSLGQLYYEIGKYDEAITELEKALKLTPDFKDISTFLGKIYIDKGNYAEAIKVLERVFEKHPDYVDCAVRLGIAYFKKGDLSKAKKIWFEAKRFNPNNEKLNFYLGLLERKQ